LEGAVYEPDPQVVAAARRGDLAAFETLVVRYQGDIWRLCFSLVRDQTLADDVCQEAFLRAFRFLRRYRGDSKFSTWLFSIARNCARDEMRRAGRRRRTTDAYGPETVRSEPDPSVGVEIREALAELPPDLRECEVLIDMFGMSYEEVSRIVRAPVGTVKSRVHRARSLLADRLSPSAGEVSDEA
jgi:RNA polymerase sigma-70 factor, ECF subfamily